jgi:L-fuculose-phosphate aldolase
VTNSYVSERTEVLEAVRRIVALGLVAHASGNLSRRIERAGSGDYYAVTVSRVPYHRFTLDDVVVVDGDVDQVWGAGVPSSESLLHLAVYAARPDVGAVIHTHSVYASAFAVAGQEIPSVLDEQVVTLGGSIDVAEYAPSASQQLAENAVSGLGDRAAVLLRSHGVLAVGRDLEEAVAASELVERVAKVQTLALQLGRAQELPPDIVAAEQKVYRMMRGMA